MIRRIFILICFITTQNMTGQTDSSLFKTNFVYINPLFFSNDVLELNDYWLSMGYDKKFSNKYIIGINASAIVASRPSEGVFYGAGFNAKKSNGIRLNVEMKHLFHKRFYTSINLFFQNSKTFCREDLIDSKNIYPIRYTNDYNVLRQAYSLIPKLGCILGKKKSHFYTDLSIGMGVKYIQSRTEGKIGSLSPKQESYSGKVFEYGHALTYHPLFHIKWGYNF
ncbi:MAG: hypothetical protein JWO09_959 [Bacteroidetes bacterium]|nr:hypothetical protein [Bacteroidota bacterium]